MLMTPAFVWYTGRLKRLFWKEYLPVLPSASRTMVHFEAINVPLLENEDVLKVRDLQCCFIEATPVLQAILTVSEVTSDAASTGVADLEATPEVTQTKPL